MVESMQQSSATPKNRDVGRGLRKIVACSQPYLAVASCIYSFWHGVIPTSYFRFLHLFHSFFPHREHLHNIEGCPVERCVWDGWISTRISGYRSRYIIIRPCARYISENTHARNPTRDSRNGVAYCGNFRISQSRLLKGTNCLFASKDHVRPVSKRLCIIFMACSCPIFVLGRLKKKKKRKKKKMEKIAVFPFSVYNSSDVF